MSDVTHLLTAIDPGTDTTAEELVPSSSDGGPVSDREVEKAVLLTIHYRDLFSCAPTLDQLHTYLIGCAAGAAQVRSAVRRLEGRCTVLRHGRVMWPGRETLANEAREREAASRVLWRRAQWIGRWLRAVPFVRMAAVTGSLAMNHAGRDHDVDLLCIAARGRVWVVVAWLRALHFVLRRVSGVDLCANCVLDESDLSVRHQNLYLAHQIAHLKPLWGREAHRQFLSANGWVDRFLPNAGGIWSGSKILPGPSPFRQVAEWPLPAGLADALNRRIFQHGWWRALAFYQPTHSPEVIAEARNATRYMLPGLGYGPSVYRRFLEGHPRLSGTVTRAELEAAFGAGHDESLQKSDPRLDAILARRYNPPASGPA